MCDNQMQSLWIILRVLSGFTWRDFYSIYFARYPYDKLQNPLWMLSKILWNIHTWKLLNNLHIIEQREGSTCMAVSQSSLIKGKQCSSRWEAKGAARYNSRSTAWLVVQPQFFGDICQMKKSYSKQMTFNNMWEYVLAKAWCCLKIDPRLADC